jgi:hypothetical protein
MDGENISNFNNINTIKYLGHDGKYYIKVPKSKDFKKYNVEVIKKKSSIIDNNIENLIKENNKKINELNNELKKIFLKMLNLKKNTSEYIKFKKNKNKIIDELIIRIDYSSSLELSKSNISIIEPIDIVYTNRKIIK